MSGKPPRSAGWPRKKLKATFVPETASISMGSGEVDMDSAYEPVTRLLPNLWIGGSNQSKGDWLSFQSGREEKCVKNRLCVVCGEKCEGTIVLGMMSEDPKATDGPGGHPRCLWVAVNTCPHFQRGRYATKDDDTFVAFRYNGQHSGHLFYNRDSENQYTTDSSHYDEGDTSHAGVAPEATPITFRQLRELAKEFPLG